MRSIRYLATLAAFALMLVTPAAAMGQLGVTPTADFTAAAPNAQVPLVVQFTDASEPSLAGGQMQRQWEFGDSSSAENTSTAQDPTHTFTAPGIYSVKLTVTDFGGSNTITKQVEVNALPSAGFTWEQDSASLGVTFKDASTDADGADEIVSWEWDLGDGTTSSAESPPPHTFATTGPHEVTLTVTDVDGGTDTYSETITLNALPVASFSPAPGDEPREFDFQTHESTDPDGTITSYAWEFGDGATGSGPTVSHKYASVGPYDVTLTVTDNSGGIGTFTQRVTVGNALPIAAFSATPTAGTAPVQVSFTDGSTDSDGTVDEWAWDFGDGATSADRNPSHTYKQAGSYQARLTVTDNDDGLSVEATRTIEVNARPSASFTASSLTGPAPFEPTFTATATDPDGSIASYAWDFGDGTTDSGESVSHRYTAPGTYDVRLTVTDDDGASSSETQTVAVTLPPESIPAGPAAPTLQKVLTDLLIETPGPCSVRMLTASALVVCGGNSRKSLNLRTWAVNAEGSPVAATITGTERIPRSARKRDSARKSAQAKRVRYRAQRGTVPAYSTEGFKLRAPKKLRRALAGRLEQRGRIKRQPVVVLRAGGLTAKMTHTVIARGKKKRR